MISMQSRTSQVLLGEESLKPLLTPKFVSIFIFTLILSQILNPDYMWYFWLTYPLILNFYYFVFFVIIIYIILYYIYIYIYILFLFFYYYYFFFLSPLFSLHPPILHQPSPTPMLSHVQNSRSPPFIFLFSFFLLIFFSPSISRDWRALPQLVSPHFFPSHSRHFQEKVVGSPFSLGSFFFFFLFFFLAYGGLWFFGRRFFPPTLTGQPPIFFFFSPPVTLSL